MATYGRMVRDSAVVTIESGEPIGKPLLRFGMVPSLTPHNRPFPRNGVPKDKCNAYFLTTIATCAATWRISSNTFQRSSPIILKRMRLGKPPPFTTFAPGDSGV